MPESRDFDLADALTVTTGRLLSHRHMDGLYDILNFLTGDSLFTHQLVKASDWCKPRLVEQHPRLAEMTPPDTNETGELFTWLADMERVHGRTLTLTPLDGWQTLGLLDGLPEHLRGNTAVVVLDRPED